MTPRAGSIERRCSALADRLGGGVALSRGGVRERVDRAIGPALGALRRLHSGRVGDYATWLLIGFVALAAGAFLASPALGAAQDADLVLYGADAWTGDPARPRAAAIAFRGDRILAVGDSAAVAERVGPGTRIEHLGGRFVAPGFIDNHTHFDRAGALLLGVNLLAVSDPGALADSVRAARDRLPPGAWIVGGDWGAYDLAGTFAPGRAAIDSLTPSNPVLLSKWDRSAWLANGAALEAAGLGCADPGVECADGHPTGRLAPEAAARAREAIPPKPSEQRLAEARGALARLAERGVTSIHDITAPEQLAVFQRLRDVGELTVRVYARPTLDRVGHLAALGIRHGFGDEWIRIGGLKGFVDGIMGNSTARFREPYETTGELGRWRDMMEPPGNMERLLRLADSTGHWPQVHAIGDHAIDTLLTLYEHVIRENPPRDRRFRVIHAQVLSGPEVAVRMARLGIVAEVQPYHAIDDMRWMEERIGDRARWAYAFRTLEDAGVLLSFGSDWPGTNASWYPASPVLGIYAAVMRQTLEGEPPGGWFPEERVDVETALRAYTVNNAWAAGEEDLKGRIAPGMLADLVVLDRSPFGVPPGSLKDLVVERTIVGGRTVFARDGNHGVPAASPPR